MASTLHFAGMDRFVGACKRRGRTPLVVGYHRVVEDFRDSASRTIPSMLISRSMLARQLDWIGLRFEFVTLDDLAAWAVGEKRFDKPVAAVTFDDGYRDVYQFGFPLLREKGIPAAVFVVTDLVGTSKMQLHDELYMTLSAGFSVWQRPGQRLDELLCGVNLDVHPPALTGHAASDAFRIMRSFLESCSQEQIRCIAAALRAEVEVPSELVDEHRSVDWEMLERMKGADISVGSHTCSHALLTNEPWEKVVSETRVSKKTVEQRLRSEIRHFAYPDGRFDPSVVEAVAKAGYRSAYTTCSHRHAHHPELTIPRKLLWERSCVSPQGKFSPSVMSCELNGVFDHKSRCAQNHRP